MVVSLAGAVIVIALHRGDLWQQTLDSLNPVPASEQALYRSLRADMWQAGDTLSLLLSPHQRKKRYCRQRRPCVHGLRHCRDRGMVKRHLISLRPAAQRMQRRRRGRLQSLAPKC